MKKILVVAPHPDDEVLGCGATMKKMAQSGAEVHVLVVTKGSPKMYTHEKVENVRAEARRAHAILGVSQTRFLDFHAPELDITSNSAISREVASVINELQIDTLFIPHRGDIHHDHSAVFKACLVAARPVGNYFVKTILSYETLSETEWAPPFADDAFIPTMFINVTETFVHKMEAMECFKSQLKAFPNPRSLHTIESLARFRGSTVGVELAESFMHIRSILT
ncbi:PIG-L deacetylase family protein [Imperialibacter roseus]|uniref:PIG-L deacetylase family protein n=1 Tax=Imperialibacter roseus TaxID=1324217 RepID=A0ABZ0INS2_9BACT|nr:PIG-L deacetylase family protein [Imperialibacter roseus]WOK05361.1 PIG-L deacetylase family protein [Imperialibacter roseus]